MYQTHHYNYLYFYHCIVGSTLGASATEGEYLTGSSSVLPTVGTLATALVGMCLGSLVTVLYLHSNKRYVGYTPLN